MATYTTTLTLNAGATEIDFAVASLDPLPTDQIELEAVLYNTLPATEYNFSSTLFPYINQIDSPPYTVSLLSTTAGFGSVYNDGVYRFYGGFTDSDSSVFYDSNAYMLNTTAIDAWWDTFLALENNTITNWQTIYNLYAPMFQSILTLSFDMATNYAAINALIVDLQTASETPFAFTFDSTLVLTNPTAMTAQTGLYSPAIDVQYQYETVENTLTSTLVNFESSSDFNVWGTKTNLFNSIAPFSVPNFSDAVYSGYWYLQDFLGNSYTSNTNYVLVTTAIDAGIAALPITTDAEVARKAYVVSLRTDVQNYFDAEDYTNANLYITYVETVLAALVDGTEDNPPSTIVLTNTSLVTANIPIYTSSVSSFISQGGWYNVLTNTLTEVEYPYTWEFDLQVNSDTNISNEVVFPDGVYQNYSSEILLGLLFVTPVAFIMSPTAYLLVTTTVDAQVTLYGDNYDPTNEAEAIAYASMLALQTAIDEAFAAEAYTEANDLIVQLQNLLGGGTSITLLANLSAPQSMVVYFETLPEGTYTNATGTIENTLTGVSATFDGFPSENTDLTTILNSEDLGFGTDFPDGVYQLTVNFYVDGLLFTSMCYLVVTTDWQCCIDKAVGKKCGKLNVALQQSNLTNAVRIVAVYLDVNTANSLIAEGNRVCSGCGCGCK